MLASTQSLAPAALLAAQTGRLPRIHTLIQQSRSRKSWCGRKKKKKTRARERTATRSSQTRKCLYTGPTCARTRGIHVYTYAHIAGGHTHTRTRSIRTPLSLISFSFLPFPRPRIRSASAHGPPAGTEYSRSSHSVLRPTRDSISVSTTCADSLCASLSLHSHSPTQLRTQRSALSHLTASPRAVVASLARWRRGRTRRCRR